MIPIHICPTGQRFKYTYKNTLKPAKKTVLVDISNWMANRYIHCATDINHNKHYIYIKTVKFSNQYFHITLEIVCNIFMYHLRATLTAL